MKLGVFRKKYIHGMLGKNDTCLGQNRTLRYGAKWYTLRKIWASNPLGMFGLLHLSVFRAPTVRNA